jgi:hypothetical protein
MTTCTNCQQPFEITPDDLAFYDEISPTFDGKKFAIPAPTKCFYCRFQQRLAFRNERSLYQRQSSLTGKLIISTFAPDKPYKVFEQSEWWGDQWNPLDYGRDFDFSRSFTEQFKELLLAVPHSALVTRNAENSAYSNYALNQKNTYLIFGSGGAEDCMYGKYLSGCKDCVDSLALYNCELSYEGIANDMCYNCRYAMNSRNCTDCLMIDNCQSCKNCIGCFGLVSKEYCVFNQFVGKEQYQAFQREYEYLTPQKVAALRQKLNELKATLPHREARIFASENCTGDNIYNSKNCRTCFDIKECEDCKYINFSPKNKRSYDIVFSAPGDVEFCYQMCSTTSVQSCMAGWLVWYCSNMYYSEECHNSNDCFGCTGLKGNKYCILNKQYTKEEYEVMVARIIEHMQKTGEWGQYLDPQLSLYGYNETVAQEYYPLAKEQATLAGYNWYNKPIEHLEGVVLSTIPEDIRSVGDDILDKVFTCEISGRPYKITTQELKFYRNMKLPLPHKHHDERHKDRIKLHNPYYLFSRTCSKCGKGIQTSYSEERAKIVYCEACYLQEVY